MPSSLLTSVSSFLYAVSSMLNGAQNNAAVQQSFVTNFQSSPTHFLPVGQRSSKNINSYETPSASTINAYNSTMRGGVDSGDPFNNFINESSTSQDYYYHGANNYNNQNTNGGGDSKASSTIYFPISAGGGSSSSHSSQNQPNYDYGIPAEPPQQQPVSGHNGQGPIEISYHDGETIATLFTDEYGNVTRCDLLEVNKPSEQQEALANLAAQNKLIEKTNFNTMLNIIRACQTLDKGDRQPKPANPIEAIVQTKTNMWTIVSGILPGTKWCGLKDIADGWNDLGPEKDLDKCCRSHDLCPRKVLAFRAAYGLVNWSFYTKSHCECDAAFYDCLKRASNDNPAATVMGEFYFNVLRVQCIDEENPPKCVARSMGGQGLSCTRWENDSSRESQRLVFREVKQLFR